MQTRTLDKVVRDKLLEIGYPIHYYLPVLHHAQSCLDSLSHNHNFGSNVKEAKFTPTTYGRVILSGEVIDVVGVFGIVGGERKEFKLNQELTIVQKVDGSTLLPWLEDDSTIPEYRNSGSSGVLEQVSAQELPTIYYPSSQVDYEYNVDLAQSQLVLGPRVNLTEVYIRYLSNGVSGTAANMVHPYAVDAIHAYIDWKLSESERRAQSETMRKKSEFHNQQRILRAKMNPLTLAQMYSILITD